MLALGASSGGSYRHEGGRVWYVLTGALGVWLDEGVLPVGGRALRLSFASMDEHRFANLASG